VRVLSQVQAGWPTLNLAKRQVLHRVPCPTAVCRQTARGGANGAQFKSVMNGGPHHGGGEDFEELQHLHELTLSPSRRLQTNACRAAAARRFFWLSRASMRRRRRSNSAPRSQPCNGAAWSNIFETVPRSIPKAIAAARSLMPSTRTARRTR